MNPNNISPDDPRLTAYALNEMEPAERAEFEQSLAQDAAARQAVTDISATVSALASALEQEPMEPAAKSEAKRDPYAKVVRFPYWMISSLAAACFAVFFIYWQRNQILVPQKQYIQLPVTVTAEKTVNTPVAVDLPPASTASITEDEAWRNEIEAKAVASAEKRTTDDAAKEQVSADKNKPFRMEARIASTPMPTTLEAQSMAPASTAGSSLKVAEGKVELSPFRVNATTDSGYIATDTLAGTRIHTDLKDISSASLVVTGQFRSNASAVSAQGLLSRTRGMEVAGIGNKKTWGIVRAEREANTEAYGFRKDNDYLRVADNPLSTFSVDVDTASYANVRRFLTQGQRPPADAVRIEELVNYFPYHYAAPTGGAPFAASLEVASAPWAPEHRLVRIGLKVREVSDATRPAANLVFLLDVSGSMNQPNKLPLVKQSLRMLVEKLRPDDRVAIAVYAGASGLALPSTSAAHKAEIMDAIDRLQAEGSTNGAAGIQLAYDIAKANFITGGVNRVILATDGDFNVGVTSEGELVRLVEEKARSGVFLTVLGYGMGNYKDATLEKLADKGNGNYAYIDSVAEAKKTLVEQAGGTLVTIAKDVKIQVEFNPAMVQAYRLIGYENRLLAKEDFNNDRVDAGEIGAGHTVTALYEVVPVGAEMPGDTPAVDGLKYQKTEAPRSGLLAGQGLSGPVARQRATTTSSSKQRDEVVASPSQNSELLTVRIRYKEPAGEVSSKLEFPLHDSGARFEDASQDFKFVAAVAAFGMVLRDSPHKGASTLGDVVAWARAGLGSDPGGYRNEFIGLVERAVQVVQ